MAAPDGIAKSNFVAEYARYYLGYLGALILVLVAYFTTTLHLLSSTVLTVFLLAIAAVLLILQLTVFLHLGKAEKGPKLNTYTAIYMFIIVLIVVGCSIWIMYHLNINMGMTPEQMKQYMIEQNSKGF